MTEASSESKPADDNYVVVARRYRPRGFDELVGQEHVGRALKNAIETGRVGHAYLFTGARGVGKTSTARIFAKALNNPGGPSASPDNETDVALAIDSGEDIDVIEIDGASNRGIDEIRSLRSNVGVRPSRSRYKIYIIDEVHMLTQAAFNALLKTLEEPPEHVKFIFCTTDPEKMPITVLSRCQRFDFAPVEVAKIVGRLREIVQAENAVADDAALELLARRAAGSMRDSQSLLEQVLSFSDRNLTADQVHAMLGTADDERLHTIAQAMSNRDAAAALQQLDEAIDAGVDAGRFAEQLLGYFRDLMAVSVGCDPSLQRHTAASLNSELKELGDAWGVQTVLAVVGLIDQTLVRIRQSVYGRVLLEAAIIQVCHLPDLQGLADLAAAAASDQPLSSAVRNEKKKLNNVVSPPASRSPERSTTRSVEVPASEASVASAPVPMQPEAGQEPAPAAEPLAASKPNSAAKPSRPREENESSSDLEAAKKTTRQLSPSNVRDIFDAALAQVERMTASIAATATQVKLRGDAELELVFSRESEMSMRRMDLPEHRGPVCQAIEQAVGYPVSLKLVIDSAAPAVAKPAKVAARPTAKDRLARMREIESDPWVQTCIETFDAEIVKVDPKQG